MNYNNLCINCMGEKHEGEHKCHRCGFDDRTYNPLPYVLPPYTPLNGKYIIGRMLGAGGFGITYIAIDTALDRVVTIKEFFVRQSMYRHTTINSDVSISTASYSEKHIYQANRLKFEQEAKTLANLNTLEGIVRVYDFFQENNTLYMVLDFLPGMTLEQYVRKNDGKLSFEEVVKKLGPVMDSLDRLHNITLQRTSGVHEPEGEKGIIHRDISPDNIMVAPDNRKLTLFDFGGAKIQDGKSSSVVLAKPGYSPIEQLQSGNAGPWSDIYAMAATIYFCLCGQAPPASSNRIAASDPLVRPSQRGVGITAEQERVLLKGLAVQVKDRYHTMREFKQALENSLRKSAEPVPPRPRPTDPWQQVTPEDDHGSSGHGSGGQGSGGRNNEKDRDGRRKRKRKVPVAAIIVAAVLVVSAVGAVAVNSLLKKSGEQPGTESTADAKMVPATEKTTKKKKKKKETEAAPATEKLPETQAGEQQKDQEADMQTAAVTTEKPTEAAAVKVSAKDIVADYNKGGISYGEASAQIADSDSPDSGQEKLNLLRQSKAEYQKGNDYAAGDMSQKALTAYGNVIAEDVNYEDAQMRIREITEMEVEMCREDVDSLTAENRFDQALDRIDSAELIVQDSGELSSMREECLSEYTLYGLEQADQMAEAEDYEGARKLLTEVYAATGDEALQSKEDEIARAEEEKKEADAHAGEEGIHDYSLYYTDGTWEDAFNSCKEKGGYLVHINNKEELDYIIRNLELADVRSTRFYIGARREMSGTEYYWADENNVLYGESINKESSWWLAGEPSLRDVNDPRQPEEHVAEMFYSTAENRWVLNDVPNSLPDYLTNLDRTIGFICEYENRTTG